MTARVQRLRPVARTLPWAPLLAGALLCGLLAVPLPELADPPALVRWPGFGALALCIAAAFLLDDAAAVTIGAAPISLARRRLLRIALALPLLGAVWAAALWYATSAHAASFGPAERGALCLQFAATLTLTLGASAVALRVMPDEQGGWSGAVVPLALLGVALAMPERVALLALPGDAHWEIAQQRWTALLAVGLLTLAWALREPAAGRRGRGRAGQASSPGAGASSAGAP